MAASNNGGHNNSDFQLPNELRAQNGQNRHNDEHPDQDEDEVENGHVDDQLFEGCGEEGPIRAIFFSEFHPTQGPMMRCQIPETVVSKEVFDAMSVYIIPKQQLARRSITVNVMGYKVLGYPVILEDKKYPRNQFMFNVCFVCYPWSRTVQFEPALRKLVDYLVHLEEEMAYLTREENNSELISILNKVFTDLNTEKQTTLSVHNYTIHLKVLRITGTPPVIKDHDVPVLMIPTLTDTKRQGQCDLTTQQILPHIDGIKHVAKIAMDCEVETNLVKTTIQNLAYRGVVQIIPIFQYSNSYCVTPKIRQLLKDPGLKKEFVERASADPSHPVSFSQAFRFVTSLKHGTTIRDLCLRFKINQELMLDPVTLIQFLCLKGIIRRIHEYPYCENQDRHLEKSATPADVLRLFDGQRCYDEICCLLSLSRSELNDLVLKDINIYLIRK